MTETRPSAETRAAEREEADRAAGADRQPTPEEERDAERAGRPSPETIAHEEEMAERGANQKGEGRIP
jgi:hypothetical protein